MKNIALILIALTLNSCISNRYLVKCYSKAHQDARFVSAIDINHSYKNLDTANKHQLLNSLGASHSWKWDDRDNKISAPAQITFNYDGKKLLWVHVHSKDTIAPFSLKVKNKGKYLSVKRQLHILPIPFCFFHWENKQLLFNDSQGRLISVSRSTSMGWVLFMVAGNEGNSICVFDRAD